MTKNVAFGKWVTDPEGKSVWSGSLSELKLAKQLGQVSEGDVVAVTKSQFPVGTVLEGFWDEAPEGFLPCDGSEFDTEALAELYELLGTGNVPELEGSDDKLKKYIAY